MLHRVGRGLPPAIPVPYRAQRGLAPALHIPSCFFGAYCMKTISRVIFSAILLVLTGLLLAIGAAAPAPMFDYYQ